MSYSFAVWISHTVEPPLKDTFEAK